MLASSRDGEEAMWLENFKLHRQNRLQAQAQQARAAIDKGASGGGRSDASDSPNTIQWLIVPRHPQRFDEVAQMLNNAGLRVSRRSQWSAQPEIADVWLGDSLGEMALYYAVADVALLGGSFAPLGGQNLIEAAACGCPVVLGPHTFNFAEAAQRACSAGAAQRVGDLAQGVEVASALVQNLAQLAQSQAAAIRFASAHRGAAQATGSAIAHLFRSGLPRR